MQPGPADDDGLQPARGPTPRNWRRVALVTALALGLCGLAVAAAGVASQMLPRRFSVAQQRRIEAWEIAKRWRTLPEGTIFPSTVTYQLSGSALNGAQSLALRARRLGVSEAVRCPRGAGPAAVRILRRYGCTAVLRATYADSTGSMVATVGVAVLRDASAATRAEQKLRQAGSRDDPGTVRAVPIAGTLASRFGDAQRQLSWNTHAGPYVVLATVGYADARPRVHVGADSYLSAEMMNLGQGLDDAVSGVLGKAPATPTCPGAPGC
jgi:hypothetical protein